MNKKKKLLAAAAAHIMGLSPNVKVKGDAAQVFSFNLVLRESRRLYQALNDENRFSEVPEILEAKSSAAKKFKQSFGYSWPF